jgi:hypothetical protein
MPQHYHGTVDGMAWHSIDGIKHGRELDQSFDQLLAKLFWPGVV